METRRPVDVPARIVHHGGALVAELLVGPLDGPEGHELPEDLVGLAPAHAALVGQQHEVEGGFAVQLEDPKYGQPEREGLIVVAALDQGPLCRERVLDPDEEPMLVEVLGRMIGVHQDPEGPELHLAMSFMWQSCCCGRSPTVALVPPLWVGGHRP